MHRLWIQLLLVAQTSTVIFCETQYSIIAPGTITSNRKYSVAVNLHDAPAPATIRVSIASTARSLNLSQEVTLQPHTTKLIDFMPPNILDQYRYELKAEGVKGVVFEKSSPLSAIKYGGLNILVESDRAIYKPEDIVQFRVIILNEHLKPVNIVEPIRVQILDADKNRVKQYKDIKLHRGVFAAQLSLSKQPLLGDWTIATFISGKYNQHNEYTFKVEKYVLPKFSVHIEIEPNFVEKDRFLKATVYGKYTFGEYVEGTVVITMLNGYYRINEGAPSQTVEIGNGNVKAEVMLDTKLLGFVEKIAVVANLTEKLTNISATSEAVTIVRFSRYNFIVPESDIEFRDEKPCGMKVHVEYWNGTRVRDVSTPVTMSLGDQKYKTYMNDEGSAQFQFEYDPKANFRIGYSGDSFDFNNIFAPQTSYDYGVQMCKILMKGRSSAHPTAPVVLEVYANETIPYLFYTVASHGNIIRDEFIRLPDNQKSHTITLNASIEMIPQSYIYAHYIVNGQLNYCEFTIRLPEKFENEISISAPTSVKPGQQITLNVTGQPNSHVSIVAVDKSSLLLSSKNVLPKSTIMRNLRLDRAFVDSYDDVYYPGFISGLITLTSAKFDIRIYRRWREPTETHAPLEHPRSIFPETWIFEDMEIDKAVTPLTVTVPDTITTWIVRAFSVNDHSGFGMMESTVNILAFQPFFISTNLPYSVKRGEIVTIPITIFNYLEQSYQTEVSMDNSKAQFKFMDGGNIPLGRTIDSRNVNVPAKNGKSVAFVITAKKVGDIDIRITAKNSNMTDSILQKLKVEPEGIKQERNRDASLTLTQGQSRKTTFQAVIPANCIPESEYLTLSISGDVLVSTLENLEDLVLKPTGCGEQNMINLAPNILVLEYLQAIGRYANLTKLVDRAKRFIDTGYQQELTYRHPAGGYSVFGPKSNSKESNWLTAYVARFFIKGMKYSAIEARIIERDLEFLAKQQASDGSFPNRGYLFDPAHQNQYGFSAFVLLAFLEDEKYSNKYSKTIENAMNFLSTNLNGVSDTYSLAIMANVFQKTGNSHTNDIISKLKSKARQENGLMWWTNNEVKQKSANDVEITAYTLLALLETSGQYTSAFNWLIKQRNSRGGFGSTQDTVVGLQALIKYAEKSTQTGSEDTQLKVHYVAKDAAAQNVKEHILGIDAENELILQTEELPSTTRSVEIEVMGHGKVFIQFAYHYYIPTTNRHTRAGQLQPPQNVGSRGIPVPSLHKMDTPTSLPLIDEHPFFIIKPTAKLSPQSKSMTLVICYLYQPLALEDTSTNMVILEVQLPSGFVSNGINLDKLRDDDKISRVEVQSSSTVLAIYFEKLEANDEQCLTVMADRMQEVQSLKSSVIQMYDFYNPEQRSEILYDVNM